MKINKLPYDPWGKYRRKTTKILGRWGKIEVEIYENKIDVPYDTIPYPTYYTQEPFDSGLFSFQPQNLHILIGCFHPPRPNSIYNFLYLLKNYLEPEVKKYENEL